MADIVLGIRLTADGKGLVGEVRLAESELDRLGKGAQKSNDQAKSSAEQFTAKLKDQAATLGMTRSQTLAYEASQEQLTEAQRKNVAESVRAIDAYDRKQAMLGRVRAAAAAAGLVIGTVLVGGLKASIAEAAAAEQAHFKLQAVLTATGNAAGLSKAQLDQEAEALKQATGFDDDQIRNSMAVLLTFRQVQGETFRSTMAMAADLSKLLGQDLQSSVLMLGKALEDPESGLTALRRAGVSFTDQQRFAIKSMVDMGDQAKALTFILQTMREQGINGVAESMNTGLKGAQTGATLAWTDMLKAVGQIPIVKGAVEGTLKSWTTHLTDMKNVIQSGNWLDSFLFFSSGYSTQRIVDMRSQQGEYVGGREAILAREGQHSAASESALQQQEEARDLMLGQLGGVAPYSGEGWQKLNESRQKAEQAAAEASRAMVSGLKEQIASLDPHATQYDRVLRQLTESTIQFTPAQKQAALALASQLDQLRAAREETDAYLQQSAGSDATIAETDALKVRSQEKLNGLLAENKTELQIMEEQLRAKQLILEQAVIYDQLSREAADAQLEELELQHQARLGNATAQGILQRRQIEAMGMRQQAEFYFGQLAQITAGAAQHNRAMFLLNKVAGIANATVSTFVGATKALEWGPIIGPIFAGIITAAGMANVAAIAGTDFGGGSSAPSIGFGRAVPTTPAYGSSAIETTPSGAATAQATQPRAQVNVTLVARSMTDVIETEQVRKLADLIEQEKSYGAGGVDVTVSVRKPT